jgi:hypothetical protein
MPSPGESVRQRLEWAARLAAFALLAWAIWRAVAPGASGDRVIDSAALRGALGDVLSGDGMTHVRVRGVVTPPERDAVAAARRGGARVGWWGDSAGVWAATAAAERGPDGRVRVAVAGTGTGVLVDTLGVIDTVDSRTGGAASALLPGRALRFVAPQADIALAVAARDTLPWRALVLARAGWEAKFVMAALEERGWTVSARLAVAPGAVVAQGPLAGLPRSAPARSELLRSARARTGLNETVINPERLDVIVLLDTASVGPDAAAIARFVRNGGGLVLAGDGALVLPSLAPARAGAPTRAPRSEAVVTRESLSLRALTSLRADAVVLETRGGLAAVAARAEGNGRVVQLGYDDTWRWRMEGGASAVEDHRAFWARALASVAPERGVPPGAPEGAPRARLVAAWGPMTAAPATPRSGTNVRLLWPLVASLLVAEWASRRMRRAA